MKDSAAVSVTWSGECDTWAGDSDTWTGDGDDEVSFSAGVSTFLASKYNN